MRTIKFRAWDQAKHELFQVSDLDMHQGKVFDDSYNYSRPLATVILEQFTGLLDKNGKEIYEGDVVGVKAPYYEDRLDWQAANGNYQVMFHESEARFGVTKSGDTWECPIEWWATLQVIGNIHENPDLLLKAATPSSPA